MITTNLSTRPFYNTRAVLLWTTVLAVIVAAATLFNVVSIVRYSESDTSLGGQASQDVERAGALRAEAARLRSSVDNKQVELVSSEAKLANDLIDRRVFSWTQLLNLFEQTLPADVRITSVRPNIDKQGRILLSATVMARGVDDVNQFMESLEKTGSFRGLLSRQERMNDQNQLEAVLEMYYAPPSGGSAPAASGVEPPATPVANKTEPSGVERGGQR